MPRMRQTDGGLFRTLPHHRRKRRSRLTRVEPRVRSPFAPPMRSLLSQRANGYQPLAERAAPPQVVGKTCPCLRGRVAPQASGGGNLAPLAGELSPQVTEGFYKSSQKPFQLSFRPSRVSGAWRNLNNIKNKVEIPRLRSG